MGKETSNKTNKLMLFVIALLFAIGIAVLAGMHNSWVQFRTNHPLWFTVIKKAPPTINETQHKHYTELETATWVRIQYDSTNVVEDFRVSNPLQAGDYQEGGRLRWVNPTQMQYEQAGYSLPVQGRDGFYALIILGEGILLIILLAFLFE